MDEVSASGNFLKVFKVGRESNRDAPRENEEDWLGDINHTPEMISDTC